MSDKYSDFRTAAWLPGPHLQTIWGRVFRPRRLVPIHREILKTPDQDEIMLDHLGANGAQAPGTTRQSARIVRRGSFADATNTVAGTPGVHLLLLHGLEGSSLSVYMQGLLQLAGRRGWRATAFNFRSCARDLDQAWRVIPNRRPRLYHSGETGDLDFVVRTLRSREPDVRLVAAGVSLGGNVLLKWLGEHPSQNAIRAAATLSVPYDLAAGARALESRLGRLYTRVFLSTLRPKILSVIRRFPEVAGRVDEQRLRRAETFREFDDAGTAPLHGFEGADDYYRRSSSIEYVERITTPSLCISAADDPFQPGAVLPRVQERASSDVEFVTARVGGHAGFVTGLPWRAVYWAETRMIEWLAERANHV